MHHLREALLSPSPRGERDLHQLDGIIRDREDVEEAVSLGLLEELRGLARHNRTWVISDRYCNIGDGIDALEGYVRSIWHMYYQLARATSHESASQDRLVLDIIRMQGRGPLTRPVRGRYGIDMARTVEGTLWNDLPFLVTDMTDFWINHCSSLSGEQRLNLATFLAKLASTRVCKDRVCQIGLVLLRNTFEDRRELRTQEEPDNEDIKRHLKSLDIAHLLPSACAWINEAGYNIMQLSDVLWNDCPGVIGQGGEWFVQSEFGKRSPTGFTPWRWMFWLKRLHQIQEQAKAVKDESMEKYAAEAIDHMVNNAEERNPEILRVYKTAGPIFQHDKHLLRLKNLTHIDLLSTGEQSEHEGSP